MSRLLFIACAALAALTTVFGEVSAGDTTRDLAQTTDKAAVIFDDGAHVELSIGLNKPLPWRVFALDQPARLVVEISNLSWELPPEVNSDSVSKVSVGQHRPGWSRLVAVLTEPLIVETAELSAADGLSQLKIRLLRASAEDFRQSV